MTFHLYIMRHAKSDWAGTGISDFDRPINKRGEKSAVRIGQWMLENNHIPQKIISSSANRARQTIDLVLKQFDDSYENISYEKDLYLADADTLLEYIQLYKANVDSLMLVAHNPGLEHLIHFLEKGSKDYQSMTTANLAIFKYSDNQFDPFTDKGELIKFIKPKELI